MHFQNHAFMALADPTRRAGDRERPVTFASSRFSGLEGGEPHPGADDAAQGGDLVGLVAQARRSADEIADQEAIGAGGSSSLSQISET